MNVTPEVLSRLRRLASSVSKSHVAQRKGESEKNGETNKEELENSTKQHEENDANSGNGGSTDTNGASRVLSTKNESENDVTTVRNNETLKEREIRMDMDVFRQMLKEVIVKRTFEIEKRLMEDVKALEKQVLALEEEKKTLQWDAKRLQLTLQEISSKHEKEKVQMISCGTQVNIDVVQERSSEIAKQMTGVSMTKNTVSSNQPPMNNENTKPIGKIRCNEPKPIAFDSRPHYKNSEEVITRQNPAAIADDTRRLLEQGDRGPSASSPTQGQTQEILMRESNLTQRHSPEVRIEVPRQLQGQMSQPTARREMPPSPLTHKRPSITLTSQQAQGLSSSYQNVESHAQGQRSPQMQWLSSRPQESNNQVQMSQPTQADVASSHSNPLVRRGPPNVSLLPPNKRKRVDTRSGLDGLHVVSSNSNYIMHNFKIQKTPSAIDSLRKHLKASAPASVPASAPPRGNQAVYMGSQSNQQPRPQLSQGSLNHHVAFKATHISPNQIPESNLSQASLNVQATANPTSIPPSQIPKPRLHQGSPNLQPVYNPTRSLSNQPPVPHFNQTPSNCLPVVQPTRSPSHPIPRTNLNLGSANTQPVVYPKPQSFHGVDNASIHPLGQSHGQLVERVLYPSTRQRQSSTEYSPRVMTSHPFQHVQPAAANNQRVEPNGTVYVVREYQVSQQQQQQHKPPAQQQQNQQQQQQQQQQQPQQQQPQQHQQHERGPIQTAHAPSSHRTAQFQHIAPAPQGIARNQPYPPVQSPGISSTESPSGSRPELSVGQDLHGIANQSDMNGTKNDQSLVQLRTPPKPTASIVVVQDGIVLSWNMTLDETMAKIDNYELFACQDGAESTNPPIMWKKIGIVKALPLPMACTLSQFSSGNKYHFAVRAVDDQERAGPFSDPCTISLTS